MRTARTALLITTLLILAALMAGCTLPGSEEPPDLSELVSPTPQEEEGLTPEVIEVTPLGERPGASETPIGLDIEAQELGEPTEAPEAEAEAVEEEEPPAEAVQPTVTPAPAAPAEEEPAEDIPAAGAILFVREGQIYRVSAPGAEAEPLTALPEGSVIRDLTVSPAGQAAAFTINGTQVALLDLASGEMTILDESPPDVVSHLAWAPAGDLLYYQKVTTNPENIPAAQAVGLWQMIYEAPADLSLEPAPITAVPETSGSEVALRFVLPGDRRLLLTEHQLGEGGLSRVLLFDRGLLPQPLEAFPSIGVLDLSPDASRLLFVDQSGLVEAGADAPVPLYVVTLGADGVLSGVQPVATDEAAYSDAAFGPDGQRIVALRAGVPLDVSQSVDVVLLTPGADGSYAQTVLGGEGAYTHTAVAWYGADAVVVQRVQLDGGEPEIWLLPLDGSAGMPLGVGEQPVVVPQVAG